MAHARIRRPPPAPRPGPGRGGRPSRNTPGSSNPTRVRNPRHAPGRRIRARHRRPVLLRYPAHQLSWRDRRTSTGLLLNSGHACRQAWAAPHLRLDLCAFA
jgi:hypothetical protein